MIPDKIIRFLEERANAGFAGTRGPDLVPQGHRVSGWQIGPGGRTISAFIPESSLPGLVEALTGNGRVALTFEEVGTHETYQIKGQYVSHRPSLPDEVEISNRARERFVRGIRSLYPQEGVAQMFRPSIPEPSLTVEIQVEEVFLQTPGPGAGSRIAPAPASQVNPS